MFLLISYFPTPCAHPPAWSEGRSTSWRRVWVVFFQKSRRKENEKKEKQEKEKKGRRKGGGDGESPSKKTFWKNCCFSFKKNIGRSPKEFKEVFGQKHPNKKPYQFLLGKSHKKKHGKTFWQNRYFLFKKSLWESSNRYWKVFVQNHPKKTHANFSLGKHTKKQEEKTFGKTSILLAKKSLKKYPKAYTHTFPIFHFYTHIIFPYPLCSPPCLVRREVYFVATGLELFFFLQKKKEKREWQKKREAGKKKKRNQERGWWWGSDALSLGGSFQQTPRCPKRKRTTKKGLWERNSNLKTKHVPCQTHIFREKFQSQNEQFPRLQQINLEREVPISKYRNIHRKIKFNHIETYIAVFSWWSRVICLVDSLDEQDQLTCIYLAKISVATVLNIFGKIILKNTKRSWENHSTVFHTTLCWETFQYLLAYKIV